MKNILISIIKTLLRLFFVFPVKQKRIFFSAYSGKQYSCNPKYISEYLSAHYPGELEIIWAFCKGAEPEKPGFKTVRFKSLPYLYYLLTSRVVVDNVESWSILPRRPGQFVINTWHGGGAYKGVGLRRLDTSSGMDENMLKKNERISLYLSSSRAFTEMTLRQSFHYEGEVLEVGMPRNDLLLRANQNVADTVRNRLGIVPETHIALFAPTFRHDLNFAYTLDYARTLQSLRIRFGGEWILLVRTHYYLPGGSLTPNDAMDVSNYPDMQELLLVSDVLITDYSSSIWDFSLTEKPAFLFMPDYNEYISERDFYTPVETWPYPACFDMDSLCREIASYQNEPALEKIRAHHARLGNCETGNASEAAAVRIYSIVTG